MKDVEIKSVKIEEGCEGFSLVLINGYGAPLHYYHFKQTSDVKDLVEVFEHLGVYAYYEYMMLY